MIGEEEDRNRTDEPDEAPSDLSDQAPSDEPDLSDESDLSDLSDQAPSDEPDLPEEVLLSRLESLVFAYPEPITVRRLARILSLKGKRVRELMEKLQETYAERGVNISEVSGGFQFHTSPKNADVVRAAIKIKPMRISRPALETLAIIAYRQPVTRADVEEIRRVDSGGTLRFLFEKGLVRILGRKEEPGRPMIYGTSSAFLELFGLKSLNDLPALHEFTELWEEHQELVEDDYLKDEPHEPDSGAPSDESDRSDGSDRSDESGVPEQPDEPDQPEQTEPEED